jgi:uncharacterized RDD family membrane protein YckC
MTNQPQPGWYYAQGDPPGTHRYWDGSAWVGEPQPAGNYVAPANMSTRAPAGIGARFVARIIDSAVVVVPMFVLFIIDAIVFGENAGLFSLLGVLAAIGIWIWNELIKQGTTGQTVGKAMMNVTLLGTADLQPIGVGKALGRALLGGLINAFFYVGYIVALFDRNNQRLTDKILSANVYQA